MLLRIYLLTELFYCVALVADRSVSRIRIVDYYSKDMMMVKMQI